VEFEGATTSIAKLSSKSSIAPLLLL
jgi:hypothetical protein